MNHAPECDMGEDCDCAVSSAPCLTIGSLFSGVGGLELGLERAGLGPVLWQAEADSFCRGVLAEHWPDAERFIDVRHVKAGRVRVPDIVCGGFPCQDISLAGTGAGLQGKRSGLWGEFARVISELRPRFVVVENVSALRRRGLGEVLGHLASCGYDATWDCIPASAVGAPHRRDRLFVVAWLVSHAQCDELRVESERGEGLTCPPVERDAELGAVGESRGPGCCSEGGSVADSNLWRRCTEWVSDRERDDEGTSWHELDGRDLPIWPPGPGDLPAWRELPQGAQPSLCPVADGLSSRLVRPCLRATGNAVAVPVGEVVGRVICSIFEEDR